MGINGRYQVLSSLNEIFQDAAIASTYFVKRDYYIYLLGLFLCLLSEGEDTSVSLYCC